MVRFPASVVARIIYHEDEVGTTIIIGIQEDMR